ncbi:hypothetical protein INS49_015148 [Diaporthe citri]|uniref:uncharacterized protein n=1 Tax=Diaporthe citri TaxID=83186 RepID=UPI001C8155C2|nr:uncharacterized protein INS49_015148 [Diaporthe citri]KAG6357270.1 hypothetical protein INS49_015148 [Diaporthe citri]
MGNGQTCVQTVTDVLLTASCSAGSFVSSDTATFPVVYTSFSAEGSSTASLLRLPIAAPMVQINWRSEDLSPATQTASSASTPGAGSSNFAGSSNSTSSGSISAGALAGAVIAGVVVLFAIAVAIFRFMRWRRARRNASAEQVRDDTMKPRYDGNHRGSTELPASYDRPELSEMRIPSELSGGQGPAELPASSQGPRAVQGQP